MIHDSVLFNFQEIVAELRERAAKKKEKDGEDADCQKVLDAITKETEFEDLSFYKEYLSGFDIEHDLEGFELCYDPCVEEYKEDLPMFLRLVAASFSSTYDLDYDSETDKVVVTISVVLGEESKTTKLQDLWSFQIFQLFEVYVEEQCNLEGIRLQGDDEGRVVEEERKMRLAIYRKKLRMLKSQMESDKTMSSLDELMSE